MGTSGRDISDKSKLVVLTLLFGIAENGVGLLNLFEFGFGCFIAWIEIGMVLSGQLPVGLLNLRHRGGAADSECLVVISSHPGTHSY